MLTVPLGFLAVVTYAIGSLGRFIFRRFQAPKAYFLQFLSCMVAYAIFAIWMDAGTPLRALMVVTALFGWVAGLLFVEIVNGFIRKGHVRMIARNGKFQ